MHAWYASQPLAPARSEVGTRLGAVETAIDGTTEGVGDDVDGVAVATADAGADEGEPDEQAAQRAINSRMASLGTRAGRVTGPSLPSRALVGRAITFT